MGLANALARLDHDIAAAESRLAELRAMRASVTPFIELYAAQEFFTDSTPDALNEAEQPETLADAVQRVFENAPGKVFDVDDVVAGIRRIGRSDERIQVRNSISYAIKMGRVENVAGRRGRYILKSTSTPVAAGVDVGEEPNTEGSSREEGGGRDESSIRLHGQDGDADAPLLHLGHVGNRAPIEG